MGQEFKGGFFWARDPKNQWQPVYVTSQGIMLAFWDEAEDYTSRDWHIAEELIPPKTGPRGILKEPSKKTLHSAIASRVQKEEGE